METAVGITTGSEDDTSVNEHDKITDTRNCFQLFEYYISYFLIVLPSSEMKGLGSLLGYRYLHKKVREVYDVMADVDPEGLEERGGVGMPKDSPQRKPKDSHQSMV